jgi:hypothetical protein
MRRIVSILGRERDLEPGEFGLEFGFGGLGDKGQFTPVLAALLELTIAKAFRVLDEGRPANRNYFRFRVHKVYYY